jgi:hypothetical protein
MLHGEVRETARRYQSHSTLQMDPAIDRMCCP